MSACSNQTGKLNNLGDVMTKHFRTIHCTNEMNSIRSIVYHIQWNNSFFLNFSAIPFHFPPIPTNPPPLMWQNRYMTEFVAVARHGCMSHVCERRLTVEPRLSKPCGRHAVSVDDWEVRINEVIFAKSFYLHWTSLDNAVSW